MRSLIVEPLTENETLVLKPTSHVERILGHSRRASFIGEDTVMTKDGFCQSCSVQEILGDRMHATYPHTDTDEDAFFVADIGEVIRQYKQWRRLLPRIEPFYAMKCNPDPRVLEVLASFGIGFDCASKEEIATILKMGIDPSQIIYANPCKQASFIRYAAKTGVRMMTFDNAEELHKIKRMHPNAQVVLRILTDDSKSICKLGTKFGAPPPSVPELIRVAKELELDLVGVSFHVGSGCLDAAAFGDAVARARTVFDLAASNGFQMDFLDVGGGFPSNDVTEGITFQDIVNVLSPAIEQHFPDPNVRVIAEPGRYFVSSAFTLAVNITARRTVPRDLDVVKAFRGEIPEDVDTTRDNVSYMYYCNDGVYGSFNCILFDHAVVSPRVLMKNGVFYHGRDVAEGEVPCSIWGPTCDSMDCITKNGSLPELDVGDWLYFSNMGAYTMCAASNFNGFDKSHIIYTNTEMQ